MTLVTILDDDNILLGMKKRGFGKGRWNGFGGKPEEGEKIERAARRETREEVGIIIKSLNKRGVVTFFEADPLPVEVHIFSTDDFKGEPKETEEMKPKWFDIGKIPYKQMWPDDKYWLPMLLGGKNFEGEFWFKDENNTDKITKYTLREV